MFRFQQGQAGPEEAAQVPVFLMVSQSQMITWGLLLSSVTGRHSSVFSQWLTHVRIRRFNGGMNLVGTMNTNPAFE